jgi:hypothetical protein
MKRNYFLLGFSIVISIVNIALPTSLMIILTIISSILVILASLLLNDEIDKPVKQKKERQKPQEISEDLEREKDKLCNKLKLNKKIKLKPTTSIITAKSSFSTVIMGETILNKSFDLQKAVLAHELVHIKKNHYAKSLIVLLPLIIIFVLSFITSIICVLIANVHWHIESFYPALVFWNISIIFLALIIILLRPVSWPKEYEADLIAAQIVGNELMIETLRNVAKLRSQDEERDFYQHPSILKRIDYIEQNNKTSGDMNG